MIKATEIGKKVVYATYYDMSGNSSLEIHITRPDGSKLTVPSSRIFLTASPLVDPTLGTLPSSTYMQFLTEAADFPVPGAYEICGVYSDPTPKKYYGDRATFSVGEAC